MWTEILKYLPDFSSAVLTGVDAAGYPISVRCKPEPSTESKVIRVQVPECAGIKAGPAGLLFHQHDEQMWNIKSFLLRGKIEKESRGWIFHPQRFAPGWGIGGLISMVRLVRSGRQTAKNYLRKRDLNRPKIQWDEIRALYDTELYPFD